MAAQRRECNISFSSSTVRCIRNCLIFIVLTVLTPPLQAGLAIDRWPIEIQQTTSRPISQGRVARAQFTTAMVNREPVDNVASFNANKEKIYFFSDLRNLKDETVIHRWEYNGNVIAEIRFQVKGNQWRAYSSKNLKPGQLGTWTVAVTNDAGQVFTKMNFEYNYDDTTFNDSTQFPN